MCIYTPPSSKGMTSLPWKDGCISTFISALFATVKIGNSQSPSMQKDIKKL